MDYLSLETKWKVAPGKGIPGWSVEGTVKIFANENEFKKYHEIKRNSG